MALSGPQQQIAQSKARFNVMATGRRFGKTHSLMRKCFKAASQPDRIVGFVAPTYKMAKRIVWKKFKAKASKLHWLDGKANESDLILPLRNGSSIQLFGAENYDGARGLEFDHLACDEFAYWTIDAWDEVFRATLSNRHGSADFASSPQGRNHFYEFYQRGISGMKGDDPKWKDWAAFHFTTLDGGRVPQEEVEAAMNELDPLTFQQEYDASFVNFTGRAYYCFGEANQGALQYDPDDDLVFCFDFNVSPGIAVVLQEQYLPTKPKATLGTGIIGEVYIPQGSNTLYVCEQLIAQYGPTGKTPHRGRVFGYGDATGGNKVPSSLMGSDWDIIDSVMKRAYGERYTKRVQRSNPLERSRVNAVNSRCKSLSGKISLMVDPRRAPHVVQDLEGTKVLEGSNGRIDKTKSGDNSKFSHMTDALGYYIHKEFSGENDFKSHLFRL